MSIWFLEQIHIITRNASPEVTKKVCYDETKNENEECNAGYPPINEAILLEMIVFIRDEQFYKSEAVKDRDIFKKEIVPRNLIPLQEKCHLRNATLSNPIKVSENVIVVTFQGILKDLISYVKQCVFCGHFYRYQTCMHGIHTYDDLSMEHLPNITIIDMAHIVANHTLPSRNDDVIKYGFDEN